MVYQIVKTGLLLPVPVRRILQMMPPLPRFNDVPPRLPRTVEPQPLDVKLILGQTIVLLLVVIVLARLNLLLSMMILIGGIVAIVVLGQYHLKGYQRRRLAYSQQMEAYFQELEAYSRREGQNQRDIAQRHGSSQVWRFRQNQLAQFWQESPPKSPQYLDYGDKLTNQNLDLLSSSSEIYRRVWTWLQTNLVADGTWVYRPCVALTGFPQGYQPDFICITKNFALVVMVELMGAECDLTPNPVKIAATDRLLLQESVLREGWFLLYLNADDTDWQGVANSLAQIFSPSPQVVLDSEGN